MPNIDAAVLARRQKDLDGYTEAYQATLEKRVGKYANEMLPTWKRMSQKLQERAKKLYQEAGYFETLDTKDAARKVKSLQYEAGRLEQLAADMAEDIKKVETQLQPYFTTVLKHEVENSYYFQAFGMEQAAQVAIQTPLLTPDRVLGVLANPWLQDRANYSARLRLNTANLALKMRGVMSEAVTYGWDWNTTARRIGAVSGEGYFNVVRLARTELNRAASLGASYMMMENADILDGKRWNATLDSRTAPKDAKNDGEIYDLDYDTPDNPGIPGQRIPNHPNCRCKYSPVLSALGISTKERIARGNGDNPKNFGDRTYTKARTYDEYAKERGLPDLAERLDKENPKKYLRPGESVADINKQVKRWSYKGSSIVVPKPIWEQAVKPPAPVSQGVVEVVKAVVTPPSGDVPVNTESEVYKSFGETHYNSIHDIVNKAPDNVKQVWAKLENRLKITDAHSREHPHYSYMGKDKGVVLDIERAAKGSSWQNSYATVFHEFGHNIDNLVGEKEGPFSFCKFSAEYESGLFQKTLREDIEANITTLDKRLKAEFKKHSTDVDWLRANNYLGQYEEFNLSHGIPIKPKYTKSQAYFKFKQELKAIPQKQLAQLSDIVEGCTGNRVECGFGHGKSYWKDRPDGVGAEAFAEFYEATMTNPEARAVLDKYLPKAAKVFDDMLAEILKGEW